MTLTVCKLTNRLTDFEKLTWGLRMAFQASDIFKHYDMLHDANEISLSAFKNLKWLVDKLKKWKEFRWVWEQIADPVRWTNEYCVKIQNWINSYLTSWPNAQNFKYITWRWSQDAKNQWKDYSKQLTPTEIQFIEELANSLEWFLSVFNKANNRNLYKVVSHCINWIIHQNLNDVRWKQQWTLLTRTLWLLSTTWSGNNSILAFLWVFDWNQNDFIEFDMPDWTKWKFSISDLYSPSDDTMFKMFWLLFAWKETNSNRAIMRNPKQYRRAIKIFMKATEVDKKQWWFRSTINRLTRYWAMAKLTAPIFNFAMHSAISISCLYTWYLNMTSYKRTNHSTASVQKVLEKMWLRTDYFHVKDWNLLWFLKEAYNNAFASATNDNDFKDISRNNTTLFNNPKWNYILMWPANIFWDTVWRWRYMFIAMDRAMTKLWIDWWSIDWFLYTKDANGKMTIDPMRYWQLMWTFLDSMADVTWFPQVEWWAEITVWDQWSFINSFLKLWNFMKSWWNFYTWKTYDLMAWWMVDFAYSSVWAFQELIWNKNWKQQQYDNAYKWVWWNWLLRRYTKSIESWDFIMPWEHASELVSKREFAQEVNRFLSWVRHALRFAKRTCKDENWEVDRWCAFETFLSAVYLPAQAWDTSHPIIHAFINMCSDFRKYHNFVNDDSSWINEKWYWTDSIYNSIVKPVMRWLYLVDIPAEARDKYRNRVNSEESFISVLHDMVLDNSENMLFYISDDMLSYVHKWWAYWQKSLTNGNYLIFWWNPSYMKEASIDISRIKSMTNASKTSTSDMLAWIADKNGLVRSFASLFSKWWENQSLFESDIADQLLFDWNSDKDMIYMMNWQFTSAMKDDSEYMQFVFKNIMTDWQAYWADFIEWVRDNKYNKDEINYSEHLLQKQMKEIEIANPWLSDYEIFDEALKEFFDGNPTYEEIKKTIQDYDDAWESEMWAYTDMLAQWAWQVETAWVRMLALVAEWRKRKKMEDAWIQYSSKQTKEEKEKITEIENEVAAELGPYLQLVDSRQYYNLMWEWFVKNHPEYKDVSVFKNLYDSDWNLNLNADLKTSWVLWAAIFADYLATNEMLKWNVNWYELSNTLTEKFWSMLDEKWNIDPDKAASFTLTCNIMAQAMEEDWKTPTDIALALAPTFVKNIKIWDAILTWEDEWSKELRERLWEDWIDMIRWLLFDTYSAIEAFPDLLDEINDEENMRNVLAQNEKKKSSSKYGWSLYYWKNTKKNYDYYKDPANAFKSWWSWNLSKLANWYGSNWKRNYAWSYTPREFYFLNQRSRRGSINSARIAPDIPLTVWGFSKTTVKSKNPVSWRTTNIKPWETKSTVKFGKSKGIVWWEGSRWPVSSFHA